MKNLHVAVPTPFHSNETLDLDGFESIVNYLKANGIESILVSATTGEQHSMSIEERMQIIHYFNEQKFEGLELIFGVAATKTTDAIKLVKEVESSVFDAMLIGFPPYIKPTQHQAVSYVDDLAKHTSKEIALYNNPPRTGFDLNAGAFKDLVSRHSNLVGLKEGGDLKRHQNTPLPKDFVMFAAGDVDSPQKLRNGCNGLSSMVGNVYPKEIKRMFDNLLMNKDVDFHKWNQLIDEVTQGQTIENIKRHYNQIGIKVGQCRAPL